METVLDVLQDLRFVDVVVASIDDTNGFGPALLGSSDSFPEYSFASAARIALQVFVSRYSELRGVGGLPEGMEEAHEAFPVRPSASAIIGSAYQRRLNLFPIVCLFLGLQAPVAVHVVLFLLVCRLEGQYPTYIL